MSDLESILTAVDELDPKDLIKLRDYVVNKTRSAIYALSSEQLRELMEAFSPLWEDAAKLSDEEIEQAIAEALAEVRRERQTQSRH